MTALELIFIAFGIWIGLVVVTALFFPQKNKKDD